MVLRQGGEMLGSEAVQRRCLLKAPVTECQEDRESEDCFKSPLVPSVRGEHRCLGDARREPSVKEDLRLWLNGVGLRTIAEVDLVDGFRLCCGLARLRIDNRGDTPTRALFTTAALLMKIIQMTAMSLSISRVRLPFEV